MAAPPSKKQKTEEEEEKAAAAEEEPAKEAAPAEPEADAPACSKPKNKEAGRFLAQDTTLNVMAVQDSNLLMSLSDGGMQYLLAGARGNLGVKSGRYMFEVKVIEYASLPDSQKNKYTLKVGVSTSSSNLFLGDSEESLCFETSGHMIHNKTQTHFGGRVILNHGTVLAVVINLEQGSPNASTVSLFKDGVRVCQPQPLPESLRGKTLFPTVTFKNMTTCVNFGPDPLAPLPFKCRMLQDATKADVVVAKEDAAAGGKCEVLFPVGLPDQGTFDRLDMFLEKSGKYVELSDRMLLSWAEKSGVWKHRSHSIPGKASNDRPENPFSLRELDEGSLRRAMYAVAPLQPRNYVVMEVKGNLLEEGRKELVEKFPKGAFKKVAHVAVGQPSAEYKKRVQELLLKEKQSKANKAFEVAKQEKLRKKAWEKKKKEQEKLAKKAAKEAQRKLAEAKKKAEAAAEAKKKAAEEAKGEGDGEEKAEEEEVKEEVKEETKEEEEKEETDEEDEEMEDDAEETPPKVELTDEEKSLEFLPSDLPDLAPAALSASLSSFSIPSAAEGFDEVRFEWSSNAKAAQEYLKQWVFDKKVNTRVEDLKPSLWFNEQLANFQKALAAWRSKQNEHRAAQRLKENSWDMKKKAAVGKVAAAKNSTAHAIAKASRRVRAEGEPSLDEELQKLKAEGEEAIAAAEKELEELETACAEQAKSDEALEEEFKELDVFGVDDILDIGQGVPVFKDFQLEDWALLSHIFELNLLVHAFVRDVADPERPGVHISHLDFYYRKYYGRELRPQDFGVETLREVVTITGDKVLYLTPKMVLATQLDAEFENLGVFAKIIEAFRRDRAQRMDLGEEGAALKISTSRVGGAGDSGGKGGHYDTRRHSYGGKGGRGKGAVSTTVGGSAIAVSAVGGGAVGGGWYGGARAAVRPVLPTAVGGFAAKGGGRGGAPRSHPYGAKGGGGKSFGGKGKW